LATERTAFFYQGLVDEVRVCKISRSSAWLGASYNNQKADSTLLSFGSVEPSPGTVMSIR